MNPYEMVWPKIGCAKFLSVCMDNVPEPLDRVCIHHPWVPLLQVVTQSISSLSSRDVVFLSWNMNPLQEMGSLQLEDNTGEKTLALYVGGPF